MSSLDEVVADLGIAREPLVATPPSDGLLTSALSDAECAISAVIACLAAAAEMAEARTGSRPEVSLDAAHVAAVVRSEVWLRDPAGDEVSGFTPLSRLWPAADGWVRTHANYPWHRQALLDAFGVADRDDAEVERALGACFVGLDPTEGERRAFASGALAVAACSVEEWRSSEAGSAVGTVSLVTIEELADDAPALPTAAPLGPRLWRIDPPARPELLLHAVDGVIGKASALLDVASPDATVTPMAGRSGKGLPRSRRSACSTGCRPSNRRTARCRS